MRIHPLMIGALVFALAACDHDRQAATQARDQETTEQSAQVAVPATAGGGSATHPAADNSRRNAEDSPALVGPFDQGNGAEDIRITQEIRKGLMNDGQLSIDAQNIKVITRDGQVVLRGPVDNAVECRRVEQIAIGVAGVQKVDNQTETIAPKSL
jgi:osmotically-inducible protein OsmY